MIFIETHVFTQQLSCYLSDEEYRELQCFLLKKPEAGPVIQGTGGLRKLRWGIKERGKQGGIRVIYYFQKADAHIYLMTLYAKNEGVDLSAKEKKQLKAMMERV